MIRLVAAEIKNYKGIKHTMVAFSQTGTSSIHPIVGLNEAGKTTFLEALTLVPTTNEDLSALGFTGIQRKGYEQLIPINQRTNFTGEISVELYFSAEEDDINAIKHKFLEKSGYILKHFNNRFSLTKSLRFEESKFVSESLQYDNLRIAYEKSKSKQKKADDEILWPILRSILRLSLPAILYVPNFLFDVPDRFALELNPKDSKQVFFQKLLDGLLKADDKSLSFASHIIERSTDPKMKQAMDATIQRLQYLIQENVLGHWGNVFGTSLSGLQISLNLDKELDALEPKDYLTINLQKGPDKYRLADRSLGFRWFFAFLMLTFYGRSEHGTNRQTVFLLDEPASNLHAGAQARLLTCFKSMSQTLFIYSTHSHYMINADLLPNTIVARNLGYSPDKDEEFISKNTNIVLAPFRQFVSTHPNQTEHFRVALDVLDVPISNLELDYPCVFVEGKGDFYAIRLLILAGHWNSNIAIYPCGGVNTFDLKVYESLASGQKFLVLSDADAAGNGILSKMKNTYGSLLDKHIRSTSMLPTPRLGSEQWFSDQEKKTIVELAGLNGSSKAVFQRSVELLVARGEKVETLSKLTIAFAEQLSHLLSLD